MMLETQASRLVEEYLALGGTRKAVVDDNAISTRLWEDEPPKAAEFWEREIAHLPKDRLDEIETLLPSVSGDTR